MCGNLLTLGLGNLDNIQTAPQSHNQGISRNYRLPKPHFINPSKREVVSRPTYFRLQHHYTSKLGKCLQIHTETFSDKKQLRK
jgi:hypothetical protein